MKISGLFLVTAALCVVCTARKELAEDYPNLISSKLLAAIEKRLRNSHDLDSKYPDGDSEKDSSSNKCSVDVTHDHIIKSSSSLANGAVFLKNTHVESLTECHDLCCEDPKCTTAVYEHKQNKRICFMFDCKSEGVCEFTKHTGFTRIQILRHPKQTVENEDSGLTDLSTKSSTTPTTTTSASTTTTTMLPTTSTATTTTIKPTTQSPTSKATTKPAVKRVPLMRMCKLDDICKSKHASCKDSFCQCSTGYHPKNGVCRKDCKPSSKLFECINGDAKFKGPDCIPIYDVCDGTTQCSDGSDEWDCNSTKVIGSHSEKNINPNIKEIPTKVEQPSTATVDGSNSSESSASATVIVSNNDKMVNVDKAEQVEDTIADKTAKVGSQGAIIALSLGLSVTALLLLFVGCRYRNMKRRLRRGRPLGVNEADYLINGMYL